jgi:hypothetical protein
MIQSANTNDATANYNNTRMRLHAKSPAKMKLTRDITNHDHAA